MYLEKQAGLQTHRGNGFSFQLFAPTERDFQLVERQVWKEMGVGVNAVSERVHPPWLPTVIKHKILPCTT